MKWTDTTSYIDQKGDKPVARVFKAHVGPYLVVEIKRGIEIDFPDEWVMYLHPLFGPKPLALPAVADPLVAQERAEWVIGDVIHEIERRLR